MTLLNIKGSITIETDRISFDENYCMDYSGLVPGDFVVLVVSDNGCCMDTEILEKICEPFFTAIILRL